MSKKEELTKESLLWFITFAIISTIFIIMYYAGLVPFDKVAVLISNLIKQMAFNQAILYIYLMLLFFFVSLFIKKDFLEIFVVQKYLQAIHTLSSSSFGFLISYVLYFLFLNKKNFKFDNELLFVFLLVILLLLGSRVLLINIAQIKSKKKTPNL